MVFLHNFSENTEKHLKFLDENYKDKFDDVIHIKFGADFPKKEIRSFRSNMINKRWHLHDFFMKKKFDIRIV